jgi:hypothetical protein
LCFPLVSGALRILPVRIPKRYCSKCLPWETSEVRL